MDSDPGAGLFRQFRRKFFSRPQANTEADLQDMIDASELEGIIDEEEGDMLQSILELDDTLVREIMVPRTSMVCCDKNAPLNEILKAVIDSGHSRIPIYANSPDNIVGLVYAKDLLRFWGTPLEEIRLKKVLRPPFLVPETKNISDLLQDFKQRRVHIAIVIDEYGGTSGLVTIEDLIEEIVGDIQDEYDFEEDWIIEEEGGNVLVDGRLNIEEFEERFSIQVAREKFDTVGGFVVEVLGRVPSTGERLQINGLDLLVVDADPRAVRQLRVLPQEAPSPPAP